MAVVLNAAAGIETVKAVKDAIDIPIIYTVISDYQELDEYIEAGVSILNISGAKDTSKIVKHVRTLYPDIPIIATGGKKDEHIIETIEAGANAITYTPPTTQAVFQKNMDKYRKNLLAEYEEEN